MMELMGRFLSMQSVIEQYLKWDRNPNTKKEIELLVEQKDDAKLQKLLGNRLEFGTAGLRGAMGAGYSQMNDLVIIQTTQGLAAYLDSFPEAKSKGVVIGHDHRHNSSSFAQY
jgi:phosphomannomutase